MISYQIVTWIGILTEIKPQTKFALGILKNTLGTYDINPWVSLNLDHISTFMDYYTVVIMPGQMNYSVDYGSDSTNFSAICEHGINSDLLSIIFSWKFIWLEPSAIPQYRKTTCLTFCDQFIFEKLKNFPSNEKHCIYLM